MIRHGWWFGALVIIVVAALMGFKAHGYRSPDFKGTIPPAAPLFYYGDLAFVDTPEFNTSLQLIFQVSSVMDSNNTYIRFRFPSGIELVDGSPEWRGDIQADQFINHTIEVKFTETGIQRLLVFVQGTYPTQWNVSETFTFYASSSKGIIRREIT